MLLINKLPVKSYKKHIPNNTIPEPNIIVVAINSKIYNRYIFKLSAVCGELSKASCAISISTNFVEEVDCLSLYYTTNSNSISEEIQITNQTIKDNKIFITIVLKKLNFIQ